MKAILQCTDSHEIIDAIEHRIVAINNFGNSAIHGNLTGGDLACQNALDAMCAEVIDYLSQVRDLVNPRDRRSPT